MSGNKKNKLLPESVSVFLAGYCVYAVVYMCRMNLTTASVVLEQSGLLTAAQYGILGSAFALAHAVGRLILGPMGERVASHWMISVGMLLAGLTNCAMGMAKAMPLMLIGWSLNGAAQAMIWGPLLRSATCRLLPHQRDSWAGVLVSSVAIGSILGIGLASYVIDRWAVRWAFLVPGALSIGCSVLSAVKLRVPGNERRASGPAVKITWRGLLPLFILTLVHGCMKDNVSYWAALYFSESHGIDIAAIGGFLFLMPLLGLVGRLGFPLLYRLCGEKKERVVFVAFALCAAAAGCLLLAHSPLSAAGLLCVIAAMSAVLDTTLLSIYPLHYENGRHISALTGILDFVAYAGSGISALVYGSILSVAEMDFTWMFISWCALALFAIVALQIGRRRQKKDAC